ncbi:MAG: hypothetical protein KBS35_02035 [Mycoplasma sp.]|nr:hypothetical protein [Candidatus Hennigella equi]
MSRALDLTGQTFGIWKVIAKTDKRAYNGAIIYKCQNIKTKEIAYKHTGYLVRFKARGSMKTTPGRKRKWIIIKRPYIETEKA